MTGFLDKAAVVTGAGSGLGQQLAAELARAGARVVLADIRLEAAEAAAAQIRDAGGSAAAVQCDVSDRSSVRELQRRAAAEVGSVDLLFANAGATSFERMNGIADREVDWIIQVNLMGVINCVQAFLPGMIAARRGHIVATSSPAGLIPRLLSDHAPYAAAKAGIIGFIENLSMEVAEFNVRTTIVYPSNVETSMGQMNSRYRPGRFGGPFDAPIVPPADYVRPQLQSAAEAAALVLAAVRDELRMVITGSEFRQQFLDQYVHEALRGFAFADEFRAGRDDGAMEEQERAGGGR